MKEQYEEVELEALNKGDVVHVSFKSGAEQRLYLNKKVISVQESYVKAQGGYYFWKDHCRFYLVEKAKNPLPTELGAVVEHTDGWKFVRVGEDDWVGIDPDGDRSAVRWRNNNVDCSARKVEA